MSIVSRSARYAERTSRLRASTIREILKVTQQPDVISFAGGLPAPELFPVEAIAQCTQEVLREYGPSALQYSVTEGVPEMRAWVSQRMTTRFGRAFEPSDVICTNGSQQGLDLIAKVLLDPGDHVVLERPSYLGAIQAFDAYQAHYLTADTDDDGMIPESLERVLEHADPLPKFLYIIPNFQNPTGRTLALERRERIVRICAEFDVIIVEDDPYGEIRFEGDDLPPLASYESDATLLYLGTGSKIVAPGLRVAWAVTKDAELREKIVMAKQGADLHSGTLAQYVFHRFVARADEFEAHVMNIEKTYKRRRDVMCDALREFMPPAVTFNTPEGGMFLWARVPGADTEELLVESAKRNVVFVPGVSFYPARDAHDGMRLNFSNASEKNIHTGIERLATSVMGRI